MTLLDENNVGKLYDFYRDDLEANKGRWEELRSEIQSRIDESINDKSKIIPLDTLNFWLHQIQDFFIDSNELLNQAKGENDGFKSPVYKLLSIYANEYKNEFKSLKDAITEIKNNNIKIVPEYENRSPYPFKDFLSKSFFEELYTSVRPKKELADVSYFFQKMKSDGLIVCGNSEFREWINKTYGLKLDRITKPTFNRLKDLIYHEEKSKFKPKSIR